MYQVYRQTTENNSSTSMEGSHPLSHEVPVRHAPSLSVPTVACSASGSRYPRAAVDMNEKQSSCDPPASSSSIHNRKAKAPAAFDPFDDLTSGVAADDKNNPAACCCFPGDGNDFTSAQEGSNTSREYFVDRRGKSREKRFFTAEELSADGFLYPNFALTDYYYQQQQCPTDDDARSKSNPASSFEDLPSCFYCPITQDILEDPVILPDGHSFTRSVIEVWIRQEGTSPITRRPTRMDEIRPNTTLQSLLHEKVKSPAVVPRKRRMPPRIVTKLPSPPRACQQRYANFYSKASTSVYGGEA